MLPHQAEQRVQPPHPCRGGCATWLLSLLCLSLLSCWNGDLQKGQELVAFYPALSHVGLWTKVKAREVFTWFFGSPGEMPTSAPGAVGLTLLSSWQWGSQKGDTFFFALP